MRVPMSWLRELVDLPDDVTGRDVADRLITAGLEVESVETIGGEVTGPLVVGRVQQIEELTEFKKPIRFCQVDVGPDHGGVRGIVCGARNFAEGDLVLVALPGVVLPGNFHIGARETYGRTSDGMICSERELGLGDEHGGIMVLADGTPGDDGLAVLGMGDEVLDVAVTPDRGYALSMRGIARETAIAFGIPFDDPGLTLVELPAPSADLAPRACDVLDPAMCDLFTLRRIVGFDHTAPTPGWMKQRLVACGMRPVSLAVDVTNYVMLELGQPLHAFDASKVKGPIRASYARPGETLETLDHVQRTLDPDDVVIRDDEGPIGLAGTMGGFHTEIDDQTTEILLEAARFVPRGVARTARRHKLSSEASRRYERGVDRVIAPYASARAAALLLEHGGGTYAGMTAWEAPYSPTVIEMPADLPERTAGMPIPGDSVTRLLTAVGCHVTPAGSRAAENVLEVAVPPWRPDLTDPADLVEEVVRLVGYTSIPSRLPMAPAGFGWTREQRLRRRVALALAAHGVVDVLNYPFVGPTELDGLQLGTDDIRRRATRLANPLSEEQPLLRTTLLPGLLAAARRNLSRGADDVAISEIGRVFGERPASPAVRPGVDQRPSDLELVAVEGMLPEQPRHLAVVFAGAREPKGWWGDARPATWADAVEAARVAADAVGADMTVRASQDAPFHPGRTAELVVGGQVIGHAGELHPRTVAAFELPERTSAVEIDLDALIAAAVSVAPAPRVGTQPIAKEDVALVVAADVPVADVESALRAGAGHLLEDVRLFDVYVGPQVPAGHRSLAFALRFRAVDRTLTAEEIAEARAGAVAEAGRRYQAVLRSS